MSLAAGIKQSSQIIKIACSWLETAAHANGYSALKSMSQLDLVEAELCLLTLAREVKARREQLLANTPADLNTAA